MTHVEVLTILTALFCFVTLPLVNIAHALRDIRRELVALRNMLANGTGRPDTLC